MSGGLRLFWILACFLLLVSVVWAADNSTTNTIQVGPPKAKVAPVEETIQGHKIVDPYRYLENLKDPDVVSLSSFIGVDGTNATLNAGRLLINLKPRNERSATASEIIRRLNSEIAGVSGIALYMQPVQDLTVEDRVSRTQYQFTVEAGSGALKYSRRTLWIWSKCSMLRT